MNSNVSLSLFLSLSKILVYSRFTRSIVKLLISFRQGRMGEGKKKKKEKRERGTASIGSQRDAFNEKKC